MHLLDVRVKIANEVRNVEEFGVQTIPWTALVLCSLVRRALDEGTGLCRWAMEQMTIDFKLRISQSHLDF